MNGRTDNNVIAHAVPFWFGKGHNHNAKSEMFGKLFNSGTAWGSVIHDSSGVLRGGKHNMRATAFPDQ